MRSIRELWECAFGSRVGVNWIKYRRQRTVRNRRSDTMGRGNINCYRDGIYSINTRYAHLAPAQRTNMADDVVIVGGKRTPFCEWSGGKRGDGKSSHIWSEARRFTRWSTPGGTHADT